MKAQQAIGQVLDNAAKFTKDGRIVVRAARVATPDGEEIVVAVRDTGIGIPEEMIPSLFEKFSVADDTSTSKYGGTGLGLTLSLKLCRLMGGDVSAESQVGIGSCFTVRLPVSPPAAAAADGSGGDTDHETHTLEAVAA
jgi:signal transduction histidine kinase